jgi:hypothetical protein
MGVLFMWFVGFELLQVLGGAPSEKELEDWSVGLLEYWNKKQTFLYCFA